MCRADVIGHAADRQAGAVKAGRPAIRGLRRKPVPDVSIRVRKDHAYGWQPTVISSPGDSIGYQRRVEEIANRLRFQFDLRE